MKSNYLEFDLNTLNSQTTDYSQVFINLQNLPQRSEEMAGCGDQILLGRNSEVIGVVRMNILWYLCTLRTGEENTKNSGSSSFTSKRMAVKGQARDVIGSPAGCDVNGQEESHCG